MDITMIVIDSIVLLALIGMLITRPRVDYTSEGECVIHFWWRGKRREIIV